MFEALSWLINENIDYHKMNAKLTTVNRYMPWNGRQLAWALYECARNPFYVLINIYVFSAYFSNTIVSDPVRGQVLWGYVLSSAALIVASLAPFLGAFADAGGRRKPWLTACVCVAVPAIAALWFARPGLSTGVYWVMAALVLANVAYELSSIFFNALLPQVSQPQSFGSVSGLAYALANLAGMALFGVYLVGAAWLAHADPTSTTDHVAERAITLAVAGWFAIFTVPILLAVPDSPSTGRPLGALLRQGTAALRASLTTLRRYRDVSAFLIARMIFNEGFIILMLFMGVFSAGVLGWTAQQLSIMGLLLSVVAIAGSLFCGWLDDRVGSKTTLRMCIIGLAAANVMLVTITPTNVLWFSVDPSVAAGGLYPRAADKAFFFTMSLVGFFVTGGLVSSRAMLARLAPKEILNEMFGLYALSGTATSFLGPLTIAILTQAFQNQRVGLAAGVIFLLAGMALLNRVNEQ
jgi:MFS transporter, UMF1 family